MKPYKTVLFADDTTIVISEHNLELLETTANEKLGDLKNWCDANGLVLNTMKTNFSKFQTQQRHSEDIQLQIGKEKIGQKTVTKLLGIQFDEHLNYESHVKTLCNKLSSVCFAVRTLMTKLTPKSIRTLYHANFETHLRYGIQIWGNSPHIQKVFIVQKRIIRIIARADPNTPCKNIFKSLNILTLPCLFILDTLLYTHKNIEKSVKCQDVHKHNTRFKTNIHMTDHRLTKYKKSYSCISKKLFNHLPANIKSETNHRKFKKDVKLLLLNFAFYSTEEFLKYKF